MTSDWRLATSDYRRLFLLTEPVCPNNTHSLLMRRFSLPSALSPLPFLFLVGVAVSAAGLKPEAAAAFDRYVKLTEQRIDAELARGPEFLWIDTLSPRRRAAMQRGLHDGGIVIERLEKRDGSTTIDPP